MLWRSPRPRPGSGNNGCDLSARCPLCLAPSGRPLGGTFKTPLLGVWEGAGPKGCKPGPADRPDSHPGEAARPSEQKGRLPERRADRFSTEVFPAETL